MTQMHEPRPGDRDPRIPFQVFEDDLVERYGSLEACVQIAAGDEGHAKRLAFSHLTARYSTLGAALGGVFDRLGQLDPDVTGVRVTVRHCMQERDGFDGFRREAYPAGTEGQVDRMPVATLDTPSGSGREQIQPPSPEVLALAIGDRVDACVRLAQYLPILEP